MKTKCRANAILIIAILVSVFFLFSFISLACSESGFKWERTVEGSLRSVDALDAENVWATGAEGLVYHYDGEEWESQQSGATLSLGDISASSPNNIWGTDYYRGIYRSNGSEWALEYESDERLICITAENDRSVWAGSEEGSIYHYDGDGWSRQVEWGEPILDMDSTDPSHVWAVGGNLNELQDTDARESGHIYFFNGESWSEVYRGGDTLIGISALDETHAWAVGHGGCIVFFDGNTWSEMASPMTYGISSVTAADPEHVWAAAPGEGLILFYDGADWTIQYRFEPQEEGIIELFDISAADKENVWLVGAEGIYYGSI